MKKTTKSILLAVALIALGSLSAIAQPTTSAPTPTAGASSVISIFSNAYTNVAGTNFFPGWGQVTTYNAITIGATDNVIKYGNMNYQGIQIGSTQDVSSMKYLHLDVWTSDANAGTLPIAIIWNGAEKTITKTVATSGSWTSLDIPLTEFTGANLANVIQFKFQSNEWYTLGAAGSSAKYTTVYLDNIYFWTDVVPSLTVSATTLTVNQPASSTSTFNITSASTWTVASNQTWLTASSASGTGNATITLTAQANATYIARTATVTVAGSGTTKTIVVTQNPTLPAPATTPTALAANVKSVFSDTYTPAVTVTAFDNWWNMSIGDCTYAVGNAGKIMTTTAAGNCGSPTFAGTPLNVSTMTQLHVDVFPTSTMDIGLKLVAVANGESAGWVSLGTLVANQWNRVNVPLTSFVMTAKTDIKQIGFVTTASFGTFYMDNLYFFTGTTAIKNVYENESVKIFPSAAKTTLNLKSDIEVNQVVIRNLVGQTIQTVNVNSMQKTIEVSNLSAGNYFMSIQLVNGESVNRKFIKL